MNLQKIQENLKSLFCGGIFDSDHITKKTYPEKIIGKMDINIQFIVVGFDNHKHPVCQTIHDFQTNMTHHDHLNDKTFFTLNKSIVGKLEWQKTYQVVTIKKSLEPETRALEQVAMFITEDAVVG